MEQYFGQNAALLKKMWVQRFRGSTLREGHHNPEPGTRNLITQTDLMSNLCAIPRY